MYRNQEEEIKTIKPHTFNINLSDADIERLYKKAYENGITPEELIADYLGDLLHGTYTRGSDERRLANEYFERCCYDLGLERSFLQWALYYDRLQNIADELEALEDAQADLEVLRKDKNYLTPEEYKEELAHLQNYEKESKEALEDLYGEYQEDKEREKEEPQELEAGLAEVKDFLQRIQEAINQ